MEYVVHSPHLCQHGPKDKQIPSEMQPRVKLGRGGGGGVERERAISYSSHNEHKVS